MNLVGYPWNWLKHLEGLGRAIRTQGSPTGGERSVARAVKLDDLGLAYEVVPLDNGTENRGDCIPGVDGNRSCAEAGAFAQLIKR